MGERLQKNHPNKTSQKRLCFIGKEKGTERKNLTLVKGKNCAICQK